MKEKFLKLKEVAEILRVSERSVFRYIYDGRLKASKVGYWRIAQSDLQNFLEITSRHSRRTARDSSNKKQKGGMHNIKLNKF